MFNKSANRLTESLIGSGVVDRADFELYRFGFEIGFAIIANILTTVAISFLFRMPLESLLFLVAFIPLRSYAGGFHASNHFRCYWLSIIAVIAVLFSVRFIATIDSVLIFVVIGGICAAIMFALVPAQDANRPLEEIEIRVYGRRARIVLCVEYIAMIVLSVLGLASAAAVVFCAILLSGVAVFAGAFKNFIKPITPIS